MKRFEFQLEKVLELRRYEEREWELRLAEVTGRLIAVEQEIDQWSARRAQTVGVEVGAGDVDMSAWHSREEYVGLIDDRTRTLRRQLAGIGAEREKIRQGYLEASRRRKALSKLKERRSDEYYRDSLRDEVRNLDEIAGSMTARRLATSEDEDV